MAVILYKDGEETRIEASRLQAHLDDGWSVEKKKTRSKRTPKPDLDVFNVPSFGESVETESVTLPLEVEEDNNAESTEQ